MIILKPISTPQTIQFIARENVCDSLVIRDEQNDTEVTIDANFALNKYYLTDDLIFDLEEGRFYNLTAYNGSTVIYKDKIFCTSQTDYSINNGDFTQHTSNNDYITY